MFSRKQTVFYTLVATLTLATLLISSWEIFWCSHGYTGTVNNTLALWAKQRGRIKYASKDTAVVIGSSRVLFGLNLSKFSNKVGGEKPIQLASMKTSPIVVLRDLAHDRNFSHFTIIGVTPASFFLGDSDTLELISYYKNQTLNQIIDHELAIQLEKRFAFMDESLSIDSLFLNKFMQTEQETVSPPKLANFDESRQAYMWKKLERDESYKTQVRQIWNDYLRANSSLLLSVESDERIREVSILVEKIKSKGGMVVFVRLPSKRRFLKWETENFPRNEYWDKLIRNSNSPGYHFDDFFDTDDFDVPDNSHLSRRDADDFSDGFSVFVKPLYDNWINNNKNKRSN
jgi:hypothetical protein